MSNPWPQVFHNYQSWLTDQMPNQLGSDLLVPVFPTHPGDKIPGASLVWFEDPRYGSEITALRAVVRRRVVKVEFDIIVANRMIGPTADVGNTLQYESDCFVQSIIDIIDTDIATEQHLHSPDLIDVAMVREINYERGMTANGCGTRATMRVDFVARYL